jgi:hypothetical protein
MGMMLPDGLVWIMDKLGFEWPDLDEDEIHRAATLVRQYGSDLGATIDAVDRRINVDVLGASTSQAALALADGWTQNRSQNLQQLLDVVDPAATGVDLFADAVLALKIKVIADVTITAAQVAAALASSFVTFGAGAAVAAGLIIARKKALDALVDIAVEELLGQVLPMVIEPLTAQVPAVVNAVLDAPVVTGAVGDLGELTADLDALEQASSDLDTASTDLETLTAQFLADLESLNITGG